MTYPNWGANKLRASAQRSPRKHILLPYNLHCGSPLEKPQNDANRNQTNEATIPELLDYRN